MNLLFICSGNTCRSPFAAALMRHRVTDLSLKIGIDSAGTNASGGHPMSYPMEVILQEKGIDSSHQSQRMTWNLMDWADVALTMTRPQKVLLSAQLPQFKGKLFTLKEYGGNVSESNIEDPYGTDLGSYRQCAAAIEAACDHLLTQLQSQHVVTAPSGQGRRP